LKRKADARLKEAMIVTDTEVDQQQADYLANTVQPIAKRIFAQIKMTGFCGSLSEQQSRAYVNAVEYIVNELVDRGVDVKLPQMDASQQSRLLNAIVRHTVSMTSGNTACCGFFQSRVTPEGLTSQAGVIAAAVTAEMKKSKQSQRRHTHAAEGDVEMQAVTGIRPRSRSEIELELQLKEAENRQLELAKEKAKAEAKKARAKAKVKEAEARKMEAQARFSP